VVVGDGQVVTNAHNLRGEEVVVTFADGRRVTGSTTGIDVEGDLAVVSVDTGGAPAPLWGEQPARLGEAVLAMSNPGGRGLRVGVGFVSGLEVAFRGPNGRKIAGAIEHTAPLARGSSGGPLVDGDGRLLGIDTHRIGDGFYLALPTGEELRSRIEQLARGESPSRVRLGVALAHPRVARRLRRSVGLPERDGLLVHAVETNAAADRAGIKQGDLIVSVGGSAVSTFDELSETVDAGAGSGSIDLGIVRGVDEISVAVDLGEGGPRDEGRV